ncbi:MAG TPA: copper resistance CopC family protein [Burkholderiales bacterium]
MRAFRSFLLALALAMSVASAAYAHAFLDHAEPAVGSTVPAPPTEVRLWFTQELEPAFSTVRVLNERGQRVDREDNGVDRKDPTQLRVRVSPLGPGLYKVVWRVVSIDTHVSEGDFTFRVGP